MYVASLGSSGSQLQHLLGFSGAAREAVTLCASGSPHGPSGGLFVDKPREGTLSEKSLSDGDSL